MKPIIFRLTYGDDLKKEITEYCHDRGISAAAVVSVVGCVYQAEIRMADGVTVKHYSGRYEIISFEGTISNNGVHFHIGLSDSNGNCIGGHLMEGTLINTTAEVVLLDLSDEYDLSREHDPTTGYRELKAQKRL